MRSGGGKATESERSGKQYAFFADAARAQAARLAEPFRQEARIAAERQKNHSADQLSGLARAIRRTARELQPQLPQTAACIDDAASGLERVSAALHERSVGDLAGTVSRVAHERPVALFAGAVLAGIVLSRALKASAQGTHRQAMRPRPRVAEGRSRGG